MHVAAAAHCADSYYRIRKSKWPRTETVCRGRHHAFVIPRRLVVCTTTLWSPHQHTESCSCIVRHKFYAKFSYHPIAASICCQQWATYSLSRVKCNVITWGYAATTADETAAMTSVTTLTVSALQSTACHQAGGRCISTAAARYATYLEPSAPLKGQCCGGLPLCGAGAHKRSWQWPACLGTLLCGSEPLGRQAGHTCALSGRAGRSTRDGVPGALCRLVMRAPCICCSVDL